MVAPTFLNLGANGQFTLADLSVNGYDEGDAWGDVNIQLLDLMGRSVKDLSNRTIMYYWQDNEDYDSVGWYDGDDNLVEASNVVFTTGTGLWVHGLDANNLQAAGQVNTADVAIALVDGMNATGNPFPVARTLAQMYVTGYDEGDAWGDVNIQLLDSMGRSVKDLTNRTIMYYWQDNEDYDEAGWYDGDDNLVEADTVQFAAGAGLWVHGVAGNNLVFTAPSL